MQLSENINKKWAPVLDHPDLPEIKDAHRRAVTAICLENVENQFAQDNTGGMLMEAAPTTIMAVNAPAPATGGAAGGSTQLTQDFADPVLISMVRRAMPQLVAYDVCGVQPMSGPTGLIFALKARQGSDGGTSQQWTSEPDQVAGVDGDGTGDLVTTPGLLIDTAGAGEGGTEYTSSVALTGGAGEVVTPA